MAKEISGISTTGTLYARIRNRVGLWGNGSSFESYSSGNYADYVVTMTEEGDSGIYVADFPTWITTGGTYEYFVHITSGSPAEGDDVVNTGKVDWSGTAAVSTSTGAMTGSDFYDYILRCGFKRTDKATEVYEAITDAIQEMRRRFMFDEAENEITTTDTITVLGDFKLDVESDFGLLLGIVLEDGDSGTPLRRISKSEFDDRYPGINVDSNNGYPREYCLFAGQIYIGPAPDRVSYVYRKSYSKRAGAITSSTTGVPFTNVYRDILADCTLARLYKGLEDYDKSNIHRAEFENQFFLAQRRETINSGSHCFNVTPFGC